MFETIANILHLCPICFIIVDLIIKKSCQSISGKTQLLFAIVFTTKYFDLFVTPLTYYDGFKWFYVIAHYVIVLLIFLIFRKTYRQTEDTFFTELLLVPSFVLAVWWNSMTTTSTLSAFGSILEPLAILPQLHMIYRQRTVERNLLFYLINIGLYYIFCWTFMIYYNFVIDWAASYVCLFVYTCAVLGFFLLNIRITSDTAAKHFLKENIFIVSNYEFNNDMASDDNVTKKQSLDEIV